MEAEQMEELENFVHLEQERTTRETKRWGLGLLAACLIGWAGWVSLGVIKVYADGNNMARLNDSIAQMLASHAVDMEKIRDQFQTMDARLDAMPPRDFRERVDMMQTKFASIEADLKQNQTEHVQIITTIGKIEANQDGMLRLLNEIREEMRPKKVGE